MIINGIFVKNLPVTAGNSQRGTWVRGGFVIECGEEYPRKVAFTTYGKERIEHHSSIKPNTPVQVCFIPDSREFNDKWYTELKCTNVIPLATSPQSTYPYPQQ